MKHFSKRPLKIIAAVAFMVALGYGVSTTNPDNSGSNSNVDLRALSSAVAQGESSGERCCTDWGDTCFAAGQIIYNMDEC